MSTLVHDLKLAFRMMASKPAFSLMVVGMLALGVAGNAAIFSIFNGLFVRPLPFAESERLVDLDETAPKWNLEYVGVAHPDFFAWRKDNRTFDSMAFFDTSSVNLSGRGQPQRIRGAQVTRDLLDVLRLKPALGRNFLDEEDRKGGAKVVMIGYALWQRLFGGDRNVLGQILKLGNEPHTVVGVLPREAVFPSAVELWSPLAADPNEGGSWYLNGIGRLKPGVSLDQARADLLRIHRGLVQAGRKENEITSPVLQPLRDRYLGEFRPVTHVLLGAVAIVLLIACANIAGLMMVRASARAREIAIRTALGASRGRIVGQLLTESLLMAAAGGVLGIVSGKACLAGMLALIPEDMPQWIRFDLDLRFLLFCIAITGAAAVLFGLAPSLEAVRVDLRASLHDTGTRSSISRSRSRGLSALVVGEIALALVLLVSAGLLVRAFRRVLQVDPGFRPENVLTFRVSLPEATYDKPEKRVAFFENLVAQVRALPGVRSAGAASSPPLGGHSGTFFTAEGARPLGPNEQNPVVLRVIVTPGYFEAIGMTFLAGRSFEDRDGESKERAVAIVNETFARRNWPGAAAVGKRIRQGGSKDQWMHVVGVMRDEKHYGLDQEMRPAVYLPYRQQDSSGMGVVLRAAIDPSALAAPARDLLRRLDPDLPMFEVRTMKETLDRSLWARRAYSWLFAVFAGVALVLAAAGIYGVISYAVSRRTHEIGIRLALGASPGRVLRQVLGQGMVLVVIGITLGLGATLSGARLLETLLFGVSTKDPLTYALVAAGLVCVALLANLMPARRAASVDPMRALRSE